MIILDTKDGREEGKGERERVGREGEEESPRAEGNVTAPKLAPPNFATQRLHSPSRSVAESPSSPKPVYRTPASTCGKEREKRETHARTHRSLPET